MGNTELALMTMDVTHPLHHNLSVVMKAAQSAGELTRQLLAFSRKQIIEPKTINLNELIEQMHKMLMRLIGEDVILQYVPHPDLGLIKADKGQIEQIIVNLAVNARDAMPQGGSLTIETYPRTLDEAYAKQHQYMTPGEYIVLAVSDTGSGMSSEVKKHLFEPFFTTKPLGAGTGLGLAMVYGAVKQNGGSIEVYSEPDIGTTVKMFFPRVEGISLPEPEIKAVKELRTGTKTILLVEDDPCVREFTVDALKQLGYTVLPYENGEETLAAVEHDSLKIHLLLTDVILPCMNGRNLAETLLRIRPEIKVLFASGYSDNIIIRHGVLEKGIHFIGKPFSVHALARKVREVLDGVE
jgi:two-component system cell cycle sensor histidine kinase/response regulator CckA